MKRIVERDTQIQEALIRAQKKKAVGDLRIILSI